MYMPKFLSLIFYCNNLKMPTRVYKLFNINNLYIYYLIIIIIK